MALLSTLGSALSRPGVEIIAGVLSGVVGGGALVATGVIPVGGSTAVAPSVALMACPGSGTVLARVPHGQGLLVTARSADGGWLQIHVGQPGVYRGWVPASALRVEAAADGLPVADCSGPTPTPLGSPAATASAIVASPSPAPTPAPPSAVPSASLAPTATPSPTPTARPTPTPTPTPTVRPTARPTAKPTVKPTIKPTPTPDTTAPVLSNLIITSPDRNPNNGAFDIFRPSAICNPDAATIRVTATDAGGSVAAVVLTYWPGGSGPVNVQMVRQGTTNDWAGTVNAQDSWSAGIINYWVQAVDSNGNQSAQLNHSNQYTLNLSDQCFG